MEDNIDAYGLIIDYIRDYATNQDIRDAYYEIIYYIKSELNKAE